MRASSAQAIAMAVVGIGLFAPDASFIRSATAGTIVPGIFELFNHPDGHAVSLGPYGLRLDSIYPPAGAGPTYSLEADLNPVLLTWNLDDTAVIEGRILNNTTGEFWLLEYNLTDLTTSDSGFWAASGSGMLTYDDAGPPQDPIPLNSKENDEGAVFEFYADGFRLDDDEMTAVGRGWVQPINRYHKYSTNDFLLIATQVEEFDVPEPASLALLALGVTCLSRRRRA